MIQWCIHYTIMGRPIPENGTLLSALSMPKGVKMNIQNTITHKITVQSNRFRISIPKEIVPPALRERIIADAKNIDAFKKNLPQQIRSKPQEMKKRVKRYIEERNIPHLKVSFLNFGINLNAIYFSISDGEQELDKLELNKKVLNKFGKYFDSTPVRVVPIMARGLSDASTADLEERVEASETKIEALSAQNQKLREALKWFDGFLSAEGEGQKVELMVDNITEDDEEQLKRIYKLLK